LVAWLGVNLLPALAWLALNVRDRALVIADLRRQRRVAKGEVEIARARQHLLEQGVASRFDVGRTETLDGDRGLALGNSRRSLDHGETGHRERGRPFRPPRHHRTARPFREALQVDSRNFRPVRRNVSQLTFGQQGPKLVS